MLRKSGELLHKSTKSLNEQAHCPLTYSPGIVDLTRTLFHFSKLSNTFGYAVWSPLQDSLLPACALRRPVFSEATVCCIGDILG